MFCFPISCVFLPTLLAHPHLLPSPSSSPSSSSPSPLLLCLRRRTAEVPVPKTAEPGSTITVAAKAVDTGYNVQPERMDPIWNRRGILNNSWFKTPVVIDKEWEKPAN